MPAYNTQHAQPDLAATYAAELATARLAALRALADILSTTEDPAEKRRAATAILRLPEPIARNTPPAPTTYESESFPQPPESDAPAPQAASTRPDYHALSTRLLAKAEASRAKLLRAASRLPPDLLPSSLIANLAAASGSAPSG